MFSQGSCEHSHPSFMIHLLSPHVSTSAPTPGGSSMFPQPCDLADPCSTVFQRNLFFQVENHSLLLLTATIMTATNVAPVVPRCPSVATATCPGQPHTHHSPRAAHSFAILSQTGDRGPSVVASLGFLFLGYTWALETQTVAATQGLLTRK